MLQLLLDHYTLPPKLLITLPDQQTILGLKHIRPLLILSTLPIHHPLVTLGSAVIAASIVGRVGLVESSLQVIDEISDYVEGRYLSSMEAAHRMLKIKLTHRFPPVMALHVHDKDGEHVTFKDGDDITEVAGRKLPKSTLRAWFKLNQYDHAARGFHYSQIPEHFRWMSGQGKWQRRKNTLS